MIKQFVVTFHANERTRWLGDDAVIADNIGVLSGAVAKVWTGGDLPVKVLTVGQVPAERTVADVALKAATDAPISSGELGSAPLPTPTAARREFVEGGQP